MRTLFLTGRRARPYARYWWLVAGTALALVSFGVALWAGLAWQVSATELTGVLAIAALAMFIASWRKRRQTRSDTQRLKDSALW